MTVNRLSGNRVLIILDGDDLRSLSLDIDGEDAPGGRSISALSALSRDACRREGIEPRGRRLKVEALSLGESCYLLVTVGGGKKYLRRRGSLCYRFARAGDMTDCLGQLCRHGFILPRSSLYSHMDAYYLVLSYPALPKRARVLLSEYNASRCRSLTAAYLGEHAKALCPRCAVQTVGRHFVN